jgi:hypothetical protein
VIRSALDYARYFAHVLMDRDARTVLFAQRSDLPSGTVDDRAALQAVIDHLCRCQDQAGDAGLGSYHLVHGYGPSYPETTGYIIPTFLAAADVLGRVDLSERAIRAADWLRSIQRSDGGWQGGRIGEERSSVVFNTAQVVRGLLAAHAHGGDQAHLDAAVRAGDWMVRVQGSDGSWARHNFLGVSRVYDSYVDAPLLHLHALTGKDAYRQAALLNLEWVMGRRSENGWFADADNTIKHNDRPITHTIAYTLDGLVESHILSRDARYLHAAERAARVLRDRFLSEGDLHGRYDAQWIGSEATITTGCAQLAIVWSRLHALGQGEAYDTAARGMVDRLKRIQHCSALGPDGAKGGITGSFPLWGRYEKFAYPNWAQKYLADALLCRAGVLPRF